MDKNCFFFYNYLTGQATIFGTKKPLYVNKKRKQRQSQ